MVSNWMSFAQIERDDRLSIDGDRFMCSPSIASNRLLAVRLLRAEAMANPALASLLTLPDLTKALDKVKMTAEASVKSPSAGGGAAAAVAAAAASAAGKAGAGGAGPSPAS